MPTLTRRELYDLVWSTPMIRLAETFGLSDVGLAKICAKHRVPTPPRGYWARKEAGYKVKQTIFSRVDDPLLDRIAIAGSMDNLPVAVRDVIERQKTERRTSPKKAPAERLRPVEFAVVEKPHPAIRATAVALRRSRPPKDPIAKAQGPDLCGLAISGDSVERIISFLDALVRSCEERGMAFKPRDDRMSVSVQTDEVTFQIEEAVKRIPHVWTDAEIAEEERRRKRRERARWDWNDLEDWGPKVPEFDYRPTGKFGLVISGWNDGLRRSWRDGKHQSLETLLPSVVDGFEAHIASLKHRRESHERAKAARRELQRRRALAKAREEREIKRHALLDDLMTAEARAAALKVWIRSWQDRAGADDPAVGRMLGWADDQLRKTERLLHANRLSAHLEDAALFPEIDDLSDPLGEPPARTSPWD